MVGNVLSLLLLLASGSGSFTVETGPLQLLDAGSALPTVDLQPASATWTLDGTTRPVVVWRDDRLGPWVLSAATPDETQIVAFERDGVLSSPQVTSTPSELWFAWEVTGREGTSVRVCSRPFPGSSASVPCRRPVEYPGARLPRFRVNGNASTPVRLGLVRPDGGVIVNPLNTSSVPEALPYAGPETIDYSFIDPIAVGFGILVQTPVPDGGSQLRFNGTFEDFGSQPRISESSASERMWVDSTGQIRGASLAISANQKGSKPWNSGPMFVWITQLGQLQYKLSSSSTSVTPPPFGGTFIDHASWRIGANLGVVVENRDSTGAHGLELLSAGPQPMAAMDLLRATVAAEPRGATNDNRDALIAWRSPLGLEVAVIENGTERTRLTRPGSLRDFATTLVDDKGTLALIGDGGAVMIERLENGMITSVNLSQTVLPSTEVAIANNGEAVQLAAAGPSGVSLFSEAPSPDLNAASLVGAGSNLRVDCLWGGVCGAAWQASNGTSSMRLPPGVSLQLPTLGTVVGLTHDEQGFVVVLEEENTTAVVRVSADAGISSALTMRLPGEREVVLPGTPPVLVWQRDEAPTKLSAMRLDTFEQLTMTLDRELRLRDGTASGNVGHQDAPINATLLFETSVLDAVYALPVGFVFGAAVVDAGVDAGSSDAGSTDGGSVDAGEPIDAGVSDAGVPDGGELDAGVDARPQQFVSCGCAGSPSWLGAVLFVALFARRRKPV